jgi:hypothetical protein
MHLWWYGWPASVRSPLWSALLATLTILGLLLAFHQVVSGAVQQGELRHQASVLHSEATWRCKAMGSLRASESCLSQLKALARVNPLLQAYITPGVGPSNAQAVLVTSLKLLSDK